MRKADPMTIRRNNRRLILRMLYHQQAKTRIELARLTGLTRPVVSDVVASLIHEGLVVETGRRSGAPGKRPVLISVPSNGRSAIGIQLEVGHVTGVLTDLRGQILDRQIEDVDSVDPEQVVTLIGKVIDQLIRSAVSPIIGAGISSPGLIDPEEGVIKHAVNLHWREVPLRRMVAQRYSFPVHIANDTDCAGLAESLFGKAIGHRKVCTVIAETGVGAGLIMDGEHYVGVSGGAGEIGQLKIHVGEKYGRGESDVSLESLVGFAGIARQIEFAARKHGDETLRQLSPTKVDLKRLGDLAKQGNPAAQEVIKDTADYLGQGIATLVNICNPSIVIIIGPICEFGELLFDPIWERVRADCLPDFVNDLDIVPTSLEDGVVLGAVSLLLRRELSLL